MKLLAELLEHATQQQFIYVHRWRVGHLIMWDNRCLLHRVVAGEALGAHAVIETRTPIVFQDWTLQPGADVTIPFTPDLRMLVYVFEGSVRIGPNGTTLEEGQLAILGTGDSVRLVGAARPGRILLLGGVPLHEPVARYGPFVMNTRAELVQAFEDYESGRMGEITRSAEIQGDANRGGRALDPG